MRLWSVDILPYLPDMQFKGQYRELVAIMHDWRDKGQTNHILINKVMEYPKSELVAYAVAYNAEYNRRYGGDIYSIAQFMKFAPNKSCHPYADWLSTKEHLRIEMANLYEKHLGVGKSKISESDWQKLLSGYEEITGEKYNI